MSFAGWAKMSPRQRMLAGLSGRAIPTHGVETHALSGLGVTLSTPPWMSPASILPPLPAPSVFAVRFGASFSPGVAPEFNLQPSTQTVSAPTTSTAPVQLAPVPAPDSGLKWSTAPVQLAPAPVPDSGLKWSTAPVQLAPPPMQTFRPTLAKVPGQLLPETPPPPQVPKEKLVFAPGAEGGAPEDFFAAPEAPRRQALGPAPKRDLMRIEDARKRDIKQIATSEERSLPLVGKLSFPKVAALAVGAYVVYRLVSRG